MANSSRSRAKTAPEPAPIAETPAEPGQPEPAAAPPPKNKGGRPVGAKDGAAASNRTLFRRMQEIPAPDWGSRAIIHLYRLEPFTDRLRSGNVTHIMRYEEPIDESRVMADHGSGKYRCILNFRKQTGPQADEMGRYEFEILNQAYPPNVPLGEWVDDPRNKKWQWAKDILEARAAAKLPPPAPAGSRPGEVLETIRAVKELMPDQQPQNTTASTLETIKAVKDLFPAPAPQTENAMLNTVVQLFTAIVATSQEEARELRKEVRDMRQQPAQPQNNGLGTLKEVIGSVKELLPAVKELFPNAAENIAGAVTGRSRMGGWQEFFQPVLPELMRAVAPVLPMFASAMFSRNAGPGMQPNPAQPQPGALPPGKPNPLVQFLNSVTPAMLNYLRKYAAGDAEFDGEMFAEQLFDMFGPVTPEGANWHEEAKQAGVVNIVGLYRQSPYWATIAPAEPKFIEFLTQFLAATPGQEEPGPEPATAEVIDLSQQGDEVYA